MKSAETEFNGIEKDPNLNKTDDCVGGKSCQIQADVATLHSVLQIADFLLIN